MAARRQTFRREDARADDRRGGSSWSTAEAATPRRPDGDAEGQRRPLRRGVEYVKSGQLGKIRVVRTWAYQDGWATPEGARHPAADNVDYDLWSGRPAPGLHKIGSTSISAVLRRPGPLTEWGAHMIDIAKWGMGAGRSRRSRRRQFGSPTTPRRRPTAQALWRSRAYHDWEHATAIARPRGRGPRRRLPRKTAARGRPGGWESTGTETKKRRKATHGGGAAAPAGARRSLPPRQKLLDCMRSSQRPTRVEIGHDSMIPATSATSLPRGRK